MIILKFLENIDILQKFIINICIGTSNKRFSSKLFNGIETKDDLKVANLATFALCALKGTDILACS
jgi:dihydropteroate synthase